MLNFKLLLFSLTFFIFINSQKFSLSYLPGYTNPSQPSWLSSQDDCKNYCQNSNVTTGNCIHAFIRRTIAQGIEVIKWYPGYCICKDGFGGYDCSVNITAIQQQTGQHRAYGCRYLVRQRIVTDDKALSQIYTTVGNTTTPKILWDCFCNEGFLF
jgi:hypothetical protein